MTRQNNDSQDNISWPLNNDRLFEKQPKVNQQKSTGSSEFDDILESMRPDLDYYYREGYLQAAHVIGNELTKGYPSLYYPMLYCYRHFLELSLKSLIQGYAKLVNEEVTLDQRKLHNLIYLWNKAKQLMQKADSKDRKDDKTLKNVERCIKEFNDVDKSSQLFRYPTNTSGEPSDHNTHKIRPDEFAETMKHLESFFDGCRAQTEAWQEYKEEAFENALYELPSEQGG